MFSLVSLSSSGKGVVGGVNLEEAVETPVDASNDEEDSCDDVDVLHGGNSCVACLRRVSGDHSCRAPGVGSRWL